jgi:hypothetical protein
MNRRAFLHLAAVYLAACAYLGMNQTQAVKVAAQTLSLGTEVPTEIPMQVGPTPPGWVFPQPETPTPILEPTETRTPTLEPTQPTAPVYRQYFPKVYHP